MNDDRVVLFLIFVCQTRNPTAIKKQKLAHAHRQELHGVGDGRYPFRLGDNLVRGRQSESMSSTIYFTPVIQELMITQADWRLSRYRHWQ